ncbi:ATP-binding protein [Kitasatospora sp. NPDC028055]|uniref:ATP-binding protein n=1 Tax=Kitasatospora sp. NPDC028055 TaxID=3155653 RepID=UPI0033D676A7
MEPRPRTVTMRFPAELARIGAVRRWAKAQLPELGLHLNAPRVEDVQLVMSEIAANAVVHGCDGGRPDEELTAALCLAPTGVLRMSVTDPGAGRPEPRKAGEGATSGRGLLLVAGLVDRFGVDEGPDHKVVWAELDLPGAVRPSPATVFGRQVEPQVVVLCTGTPVRVGLPRSAVGMRLGQQPELDRIPAA